MRLCCNLDVGDEDGGHVAWEVWELRETCPASDSMGAKPSKQYVGRSVWSGLKQILEAYSVMFIRKGGRAVEMVEGRTHESSFSVQVATVRYSATCKHVASDGEFVVGGLILL